MRKPDPDYVPALRFRWLTPVYDTLIGLIMREDVWRPAMIEAVDLHPQDVVLDIGCGTGTLLIQMKAYEPEARMIGLDPDPAVLAIAKAKAVRAHADIAFFEGLGHQWPMEVANAGVSKVVSSLVLHQVPVDGKASIIDMAYRHLIPGGAMTIADYGPQSGLVRAGFFMTQMLDGFAATQANADGILPRLLTDCGFAHVTERWRVATIAGSISLYTAVKPVS